MFVLVHCRAHVSKSTVYDPFFLFLELVPVCSETFWLLIFCGLCLINLPILSSSINLLHYAPL